MDNIKSECRFCKYYYVRNYTPDDFVKCRVHEKKEKPLWEMLPITAHIRVTRLMRLSEQSGIRMCPLDCNDCPLISDYCANPTDDHCKYRKTLTINNKKENL